MKNVTITLEEEVLRWAKVTAAKQDTSVSRMLGKELREKMQQEHKYEQAMKRFQSRLPQKLKEKMPPTPQEKVCMSANIFVDTNILLYARDSSEPAKQAVSPQWLNQLWLERTGRLSIQVLNEYFVNVTRKLNPGLSPEEAWDDLEALQVWKPIALDFSILQRGYFVQNRYQLSWLDSLIIAAAEASACSTILSEGLSHGSKYLGIEVVNPFV